VLAKYGKTLFWPAIRSLEPVTGFQEPVEQTDNRETEAEPEHDVADHEIMQAITEYADDQTADGEP
jgi:hypothetical protein